MLYAGQLVVRTRVEAVLNESALAITDRDPARPGVVYTVADAFMSPGYAYLVINLAEFPAGLDGLRFEWDAELFRPVDEARLTVFNEMLTRLPEYADAD